MSILQTAKDGAATVASLHKFIVDLTTSKNSMAITQAAKAATVVSRCYIDDVLGSEEIMIPLLGVLNQVYIGYIFTVLGLEQTVTGGRSVRDLTTLVATESLEDSAEVIKAEFGTKLFLKEEASTSSNLISLSPDEQYLVAGRMMEINFGGISDKDGKKSDLVVRILVQLVPKLTPPDVVGSFVKLSTEASFLQRWNQLRAGEISFWRDFVLARDQVERFRKAVRGDKSGELAAIFGGQMNALAKHWANASNKKNMYNAASSIVVIGKNAFDKGVAEGPGKWSEAFQKDYFSKSMTLFLVVVDTMHNLVDMYSHGIHGKATYGFAQIEKNGASNKGGLSMKDVMTMFGRGENPRF